MLKAERRAEVRQLWMERPEKDRTEHHIFLFYNWLIKNRPDLLPPATFGDPYPLLIVELRGLTTD